MRSRFVEQEALNQQQAESLVDMVVTLAEEDVDPIAIVGYMHGYISGCTSDYNRDFPTDGERDYCGYYGNGWYDGRSTRPEEDEEVVTVED